MRTYYWRTKLYFKPFDSIWMVNFQRFLFYSCFFLVEGWRCWCGHGPINISLSSNNMFSFSFCWKWVWERFRCGLCPFSILVVLPLSPLTNLPSYLWWDSSTPQILPIRRNWWKYHCDLYIHMCRGHWLWTIWISKYVWKKYFKSCSVSTWNLCPTLNQ